MRSHVPFLCLKQSKHNKSIPQGVRRGGVKGRPSQVPFFFFPPQKSCLHTASEREISFSPFILFFMAVNTAFVTIVATTGASGAAGFTAMAAAHQVSVNAGLTGATATNGYVANSAQVLGGSGRAVVDTDSHIQTMTSVIQYIRYV